MLGAPKKWFQATSPLTCMPTEPIVNGTARGHQRSSQPSWRCQTSIEVHTAHALLDVIDLYMHVAHGSTAYLSVFKPPCKQLRQTLA